MKVANPLPRHSERLSIALPLTHKQRKEQCPTLRLLNSKEANLTTSKKCAQFSFPEFLFLFIVTINRLMWWPYCGQPFQFQLTKLTRMTVAWITKAGLRSEDFLIPS